MMGREWMGMVLHSEADKTTINVQGKWCSTRVYKVYKSHQKNRTMLVHYNLDVLHDSSLFTVIHSDLCHTSDPFCRSFSQASSRIILLPITFSIRNFNFWPSSSLPSRSPQFSSGKYASTIAPTSTNAALLRSPVTVPSSSSPAL